MKKFSMCVGICLISLFVSANANAYGRGHSFMTHGLAAAGGAVLGYMAGRSSESHNYYPNHTTIVEQQPQTVVVERPDENHLTDCSITRRAPEVEQDGYLHQVFIKDCIVQR